MEGRRILYSLFAAAAVTGLAACGREDNVNYVETPTINVSQASDEPTPISSPLRELVDEELARDKSILREEITIHSNWQLPVDVRNFTDHDVNPDAISALYNAFNSMADPHYPFSNIPYNLNGEEINVILLPKFLIYPTNKASVTLIDDFIESIRPGMTEYRNGELFTYAVAKDFGSSTIAPGFAAFSLPVEICHQVIFVGGTDSNGQLLSDEDDLFNLQEVACNTLGHAFGAKASGYSSEKYQKTIAPTLVFGLPRLDIPEEMYNSLPQTGLVLK